ncbi:hypothetical protein MNB_ARC-1_872 [hydrothermal vent metagenome]|uniref:Uncharacterized protein n=1 Tax=hydrothermal vent metagenome TaxID=652676 RepID=A0A3B1DVZ0_9ZZZZ
MNIKQSLSTFDFEDTISLKCTDDKDTTCMLFIDNVQQDDKITNLFKECPQVYEYSKNQTRLEFNDIKLKNLETLSICFEFTLNKNGHSNQMIVETKDDVFIYDNISLKPTKIRFINDISYFFDDKIDEVKNAF